MREGERRREGKETDNLCFEETRQKHKNMTLNTELRKTHFHYTVENICIISNLCDVFYFHIPGLCTQQLNTLCTGPYWGQRLTKHFTCTKKTNILVFQMLTKLLPDNFWSKVTLINHLHSCIVQHNYSITMCCNFCFECLMFLYFSLLKKKDLKIKKSSLL